MVLAIVQSRTIGILHTDERPAAMQQGNTAVRLALIDRKLLTASLVIVTLIVAANFTVTTTQDNSRKCPQQTNRNFTNDATNAAATTSSIVTVMADRCSATAGSITYIYFKCCPTNAAFSSILPHRLTKSAAESLDLPKQKFSSHTSSCNDGYTPKFMMNAHVVPGAKDEDISSWEKYADLATIRKPKSKSIFPSLYSLNNRNSIFIQNKT